MTTQTDQAELLFFVTPGCPTCKAMRPVADEVAAEFGDTVRFEEVDASADPVSSSAHRVRGVPTFVAFHDGEEVGRAVGSRTAAQLSELFDAASTGRRSRGLISPTDRILRIGIGVVFAVAAAVTSTPILWAFALAAIGFASWDLVRP